MAGFSFRRGTGASGRGRDIFQLGQPAPAKAREAEIGGAGRAWTIFSVDDNVRKSLSNPCFQLGRVRGQVVPLGRYLLRRKSEAGDTGHRFGAGPQPGLLASPAQQGID